MIVTIDATPEQIRDLFAKPQQETHNSAEQFRIEQFHFAVAALYRAGERILAIKLYRLITNKGLMESKTACEQIAASYNW